MNEQSGEPVPPNPLHNKRPLRSATPIQRPFQSTLLPAGGCNVSFTRGCGFPPIHASLARLLRRGLSIVFAFSARTIGASLRLIAESRTGWTPPGGEKKKEEERRGGGTEFNCWGGPRVSSHFLKIEKSIYRRPSQIGPPLPWSQPPRSGYTSLGLRSGGFKRAGKTRRALCRRYASAPSIGSPPARLLIETCPHPERCPVWLQNLTTCGTPPPTPASPKSGENLNQQRIPGG